MTDMNITHTDAADSNKRVQQDNKPPQEYLRYVEKAVKLARSLLKVGGTVPMCAFLGNDATGLLSPLISTTDGKVCGNLSTEQIMMTAAITNADFILLIGASWKIRKNCVLNIEEVRLKYGSIEASPYAVEACSFVLETRAGIWLAQPEIRSNSRARCIDRVEFRRADTVEGQNMRLLPERK